jgi:hypothetical protein
LLVWGLTPLSSSIVTTAYKKTVQRIVTNSRWNHAARCLTMQVCARKAGVNDSCLGIEPGYSALLNINHPLQPRLAYTSKYVE